MVLGKGSVGGCERLMIGDEEFRAVPVELEAEGETTVGGCERLMIGDEEFRAIPVELEGEGGTIVDVAGTKGRVPMILVTTDDDRIMGGGMWIIEVVLITSLLPPFGDVMVLTKEIVTRIVDTIGAVGVLGCEVETFEEKVEMVDVFVKMTVVGVMVFVILTELFGNPREGVMLFSDIIGTFKEVVGLVDMPWFPGVEVVINESLEELGEVP